MNRLLVFALRVGVVVVATASALFVVSGCRVGYPFRGPGYDADLGVKHPDAGRQVLVVVTRGDVEAGSKSVFANDLRTVMDGMNEQDGLVGFAVRKEVFGSRVWTMSVWVDRASVEQFVHSTAHRKAIESGAIARGSFISADTLVDASVIPPSWTEAERMLDGRASQE